MTNETEAGRGGHPDDGELAAYIERRLAPEERERVGAHVRDCDECAWICAESVEALREPFDARRHDPSSAASQHFIDTGRRLLLPQRSAVRAFLLRLLLALLVLGLLCAVGALVTP